MKIPPARTSVFVALTFLLTLTPLSASVDRGWSQVSLDQHGVFFDRFVPDDLDLSLPAPLIVFLHGSGSLPQNYRGTLESPAEDLDAVLVMPKSSSPLGWGFGDDRAIVGDSLAEMLTEMEIDEQRIAIAGHSAGGGYAYLLAYLDPDSSYSGVFTMNAPYLPVRDVVDPIYTAPIRMYYGQEDPDFPEAHSQLAAQWGGLGVEWEEETLPGFAHNNWPQSAVFNGFQFLLAQQRVAQSMSTCATTDTELCLREGRFKVTIDWQDFDGNTGQARVSSLRTDDSGVFFFFDKDNWEVLVKVIDGCAVTGHQWVFSAASTNIQYTLTVTDLETDRVATYTNPLGEASAAVTDTSAFPCETSEP